MIKYYTRACNFYYGSLATSLIIKKKALPLCGNTKIAFDKVEILKRNNQIVKSKIIKLNELKNLNDNEKLIIKKILKKFAREEKILSKI